jgi:hypothetical protein
MTTKTFNLLLTALLLVAASTMRLELTERDPVASLVFETNGKHTFYAMSSGKEKHEISVTIDFRGQIVYNQTGTDL